MVHMRQPFTAPDVRPATIFRWNKRTSTTAGTGRALSVDVSEIPKTKSFQAKKKVRMAAVKTPGAARGTITLRNACHGVAPSIWAACSISHGISRKKAESVQIAKGRVKVM